MTNHRSNRITIRLTNDEYQALGDLRRLHGGTYQRVLMDALLLAYSLHDRAESIRIAKRAQFEMQVWARPDTWSGKEDPDEEYERELMRHELG